jgi:para-aminobenzoate synthetase component 1
VKLVEKSLGRVFTGDELTARLTQLPPEKSLCLLDSCGVRFLDSRFLIAGLEPVTVVELTATDSSSVLSYLDERLPADGLFSFFTLSYNFGLKLEPVLASLVRPDNPEPDLFLAQFEAVVVHDYLSGETSVIGRSDAVGRAVQLLAGTSATAPATPFTDVTHFKSDFTADEYIAKVRQIQEQIRSGLTYQTNLTQQLTGELSPELTPEEVFKRLRKNHPATFGAFLRRKSTVVVSASPERFLRVRGRAVSTSPIKGTRRRGQNDAEDLKLRQELQESAKDQAENIMIVDLLRNDLGRICEFGSVQVEKLCELETHASLFHLVSTVCGTLRPSVSGGDILRAMFPCGSITGAPKISTMRIIAEAEKNARGLSMGAIGFARGKWSNPGAVTTMLSDLDLSVAIRTLVIRDRTATFNVGGGIVIDSDPACEYQETLTKAAAIFGATNGTLIS